MLYKNTLIKIKRSLGRFISLFIVMLVGVGFFAGIQASAPDMIESLTKYNNDHKLMDFQIVSTIGLTDEDANTLRSLENVSNVIPSYSVDVLDNGKAIRIHAIEESANTVQLIDGRMPQADNECIADSYNYKTGDKITISSDISGKLKNSQFIVVGTVQSPLYLSHDYGNTAIGNGKLSSFIFVDRNNFKLNLYTEIYVMAVGTEDVTAYSKEYYNITSQLNDELIKLKSESESSDKSSWIIFDRNTAVAGYEAIKSGTNAVDSVSKIFPLFFILVVMLMSSNTMSRMITEERGELGTLSSLGFKNRDIISTYLFYVLSATVFGVVIGFFVGCTIVPKIIYACFPYILPHLIISYNIVTFFLILIVAAVLMTLVTVISCNKELKGTPANLLRPVPPKCGQTILLEKIDLIWKRLSFTWKVTMRNIFRYKQRVIMTIVGIAGCTALLLTGFGIRDSINGIVQKQYDEIFKYNNLIVLKNDVHDINGDLGNLLKNEQIQNPTLIKQITLSLESDTKSDAFLIVPENEEEFYKYFNLKNPVTGDGIKLDNGGVIISQKLSEIYKAEKGDTLKVNDVNNNSYTLPVSDVTENYIQDYIYINKDLYRERFNKPAAYNVLVSDYAGNEKTLAERLIASNMISDIIFKSDMSQQAIDGNKSLNSVVLLLVCISSILMIIVLYNLTSINISERQREIATLKVLGFSNNETNEYIYREVLLLTLLSIGVGLILGIGLHRLVMSIINENTSMLYFKNIKVLSFILTSLITAVVSVVMQIVTYFKLKTIDMVESLKSVE